MMRRCNRQLVYAHMIATHGRRDAVRHEAYVLKQLREPLTWHGSVIHQILAKELPPALLARRSIDWQNIRARARELAQRQFAFSAARHYRDPAHSKSADPFEYCALAGHETPEGLPASTLDNALTSIDHALAFLAEQKRFLAYLQRGSGYRSETQLSFRVPAMTTSAMAMLALFFFRGHGKPTVIDWKIGKSETADYQRQLHVYALALLRSGEWPAIRLEHIHLIEVNLLREKIRKHTLTEDQLVDIEDFVFRGACELEALVGDTRTETVRITDYAVAGNPNTCAYCAFRCLCQSACSANAPLPQLGLFDGDILND
jgi:hypothetical protein